MSVLKGGTAAMITTQPRGPSVASPGIHQSLCDHQAKAWKVTSHLACQCGFENLTECVLGVSTKQGQGPPSVLSESNSVDSALYGNTHVQICLTCRAQELKYGAWSCSGSVRHCEAGTHLQWRFRMSKARRSLQILTQNCWHVYVWPQKASINKHPPLSCFLMCLLGKYCDNIFQIKKYLRSLKLELLKLGAWGTAMGWETIVSTN